MRSFYTSIFIFFLLFYSFTSFTQNPQQLDIYDFVVYSIKDIKLAEEVKVMPSSISGFGYVGSKENISFKKSSVINANIFGRGTVDLDKELSITGNITANNSKNQKIDILKADKNVKITGNVVVNGAIKINPAGSMITGSVKQPPGASYTGPSPSGGKFNESLTLPIYPALPVINDYKEGTINVTGTTSISAGTFNNVSLANGQKLTLSGVGTYVFKSLVNTGNGKVYIDFDFQNSPTG